uniref:Uncharacterized protein n=1 Tax=Panagrolaimus superbus TaxID=310955 RepID=A0A914XUA5_9BILA
MLQFDIFIGRITVPVFIHNWEFRYSAKPNNKLSDEVKEAGKRAKIYANDSKLEANYNYKESPTPSEEVSEDKVSKISKVSKKALLDDDLLSSSNSSKKRRLKEREEKERRQKKKKEKEEKEKKRNKKDGRIKADKNTTLESKEQISNASVSRDMAKEWAKTKK